MIEIDQLPRLCANLLPEMEKKKSGVIGWNNNKSNVRYIVDKDNCVLTLRYHISGMGIDEDVNQDITYIRKQSNLGAGNVYFFICPSTQSKCRKLYFVDCRFVSRLAFKHIYIRQKESKLGRILWCAFKERKVKYRKMYYKNKLTPFGKKMQKAVERERKAVDKVEYLINRNKKLLERIP